MKVVLMMTNGFGDLGAEALSIFTFRHEEGLSNDVIGMEDGNLRCWLWFLSCVCVHLG